MRCLRNKASIARLKLSFAAIVCGLVATPVQADNIGASCVAGQSGAAILVKVSNILYDEGNLRAQIYSSDPEEFLEKGTKLYRKDVPVRQAGEQEICVPVPGPDTYALVVMHDRNKNGKADFFSEGFGFSNNPKLRFSPPDAEEVMIKVPSGVLHVPVELYYILGSGDDEQKKRRKLRRR